MVEIRKIRSHKLSCRPTINDGLHALPDDMCNDLCHPEYLGHFLIVSLATHKVILQCLIAIHQAIKGVKD